MEDRAERSGELPAGETYGFRPSGRQIGGILAAIVLLVFILSNRESVEVNFLFLHFTWPLWLTLAVTALLGAAVGGLLTVRRRRRRRTERRESRRGHG